MQSADWRSCCAQCGREITDSTFEFCQECAPKPEVYQPIWREGWSLGIKNIAVQHAGAIGQSSVSDGAFAREPLGAVCYVCGRVCLVNSLQRHTERCALRGEIYKEPPSVPFPPAEHSFYSSLYRGPRESAYLNESDEEAAKAADAAALALLEAYNEAARVSRQCECAHCGRSFAEPERLTAHEERCSWPRASMAAVESTQILKEDKPLCPVCGRYTLLKSLFRHLNSCKCRWERHQEVTKAHDQRRPAPAWPDISLPKTANEIHSWNEAVRNQRKAYDCPGCPRSFERSRACLQHAQRCCPEFLELLGNDMNSDSENETEKLRRIAWAQEPSAVALDKRTNAGVVCFVCGCRYGTASVANHMLVCEQRWQRANDALPPAARRFLTFPPESMWPPPVSDSAKLQAYNTIAAKLYEDASYVSCPRCERTFAQVGARRKHMKHCCPEQQDIVDEIVDTTHQEDPRNYVVCYICNKSVCSPDSFRWHLRKCRTRWKAANALEPKHRRRKFPQVPCTLKIPDETNKDPKIIQEWNRAVQSIFERAQHMCPGERCGRTFDQQTQLHKHMTACCPKFLREAQDVDRVAELEGRLPLDRSKTIGIPCHICGRRVLSQASLPFHFSCCMRHFHAIEDEAPAVEQQQLPAPPAITDVYACLIGEVSEGNDKKQLALKENQDEEEDEYSDDEDHDELLNRDHILLCYTCGSIRESEDTIAEHVNSCRARWQRRERLRPRAWRRQLPQVQYARLPGPHSSPELIEKWSTAVEAADQVSRNVNKCDNCGRTFSARDRLEVHQKSCHPVPQCRGCDARFERGPRGQSQLRAHEKRCDKIISKVLLCENAAEDQKVEIAMPKGCFCYLCGRSCLITSIAIHLTRCKSRWIAMERETRRQDAIAKGGECYEDENEIVAPNPPTLQMPTIKSTRDELEAYSAEAELIFRGHCPKCSFCSRVFAETAKLKKHKVGGCSNLQWDVIIPLAPNQLAADLFLALSEDENLANAVDSELLRWVGRRLGGVPLDRINVEHVNVADRGESTAISVSGGAYGFKTSRDATVARERWRNYDQEHFDDEPDDSGTPIATPVAVCHRSGVANIQRSTFLRALGQCLQLAGKGKNLLLKKQIQSYDGSQPFRGRVRSCKNAYRRRLQADEHEKRNRQLAERLRKARAVVTTNRTDPTIPRHCHSAVNRRREAREIQHTNKKIGRALTDIYSNPHSRLEELGVEAVNLVDRFSHRTALYAAEKHALRKCNDLVIPKGLGLAQCKACGSRAYFGSSKKGTSMFQCECGESYCDATCCAVDAPAHALVCAHATGRRKKWPTKLAKYWVESRATLVARKALRRRPKPSLEEIMREVALARAKEEEEDKASGIDKSTSRVARRKSTALVITSRNEANLDAWQLECDEFKDAAARRVQQRQAYENAFDAHAKELREQNREAEISEERRVEWLARKGTIEERIALLDDQALAIAQRRRDAINELEATQAHDQELARQPRRAGKTKAELREHRLAAEADSINHPRPSARDIGAFYSSAAFQQQQEQRQNLSVVDTINQEPIPELVA